ncbi:hypothetical protein T03_10571 [Trichinella britovi]|uniref:Uncharacterized protein n=1 Tax=Trichinella britovi TaxID=45882 RepID=A0A0V1CA07_TRIBR|nr:hypothetical protein T03_10571 [Trichinella britovi]
MYRLAEVEVAALYLRIREVALNRRYQGCFKITDNGFGTTRSRFSLIGLCPRYFIGPSLVVLVSILLGREVCRTGFPCLIAN